MVTSHRQLEEIRRGSRYCRLQVVLQPAKVGTMSNNLQRALRLEKLTLTLKCADPDDAFLLAIAIQGKADNLVTGDKRAGLLERGHVERIRIFIPTLFCVAVL